ncbi:MAG: thioredoxin [Planctomycetota bacterium]|nr:thioredoxin [Planctomycetota bacterium]
MSSENVVELTDANFDDEVVNSNIPVLVDFWAEWCMPCKMIAPIIDELADEYAGKVKFGKINIDSNRQAAMQQGIQAIPTLLLFKGGKVEKKIVGVKGKNDMKAIIDAVQ